MSNLHRLKRKTHCPKKKKYYMLSTMMNQIWKKKEEEGEHESRCSICDNKMILCMTTGQQNAFCNSGCVKKPWTEGLVNIVMVEAFYKISINFMWKDGGTISNCDEHSEPCRLIRGPNNVKDMPELAKRLFLVCSLPNRNDPCNFAHLATKVKSNAEEYNLLKT